MSNYHDLNERHRLLLKSNDFESNCKQLLELIQHNGKLIDILCEDVESMFENSGSANEEINVNFFF
jgi:hypothetical protein